MSTLHFPTIIAGIEPSLPMTMFQCLLDGVLILSLSRTTILEPILTTPLLLAIRFPCRRVRTLAVLPGVELNVSPGVHLLAILPEGGSSAISDLLSRLGLQPSDQGDATKLISQPIADIARIVHERRGLLIGAHCNSHERHRTGTQG